MMEHSIWDILWICFSILLLFSSCSSYLGKAPLKKIIAVGLLVVIALTGVSYLRNYLPYHIAIGVSYITLFLSIFLVSKYLARESLKESIKEGL